MRLKFIPTPYYLPPYSRLTMKSLTNIVYNSPAGPVQTSVNMGPLQPPQCKGHVPQYSCQVFRCPEDIRVTVEYLNPSFLVKKPSGGFCLVSPFTDVGHYSKVWLHLCLLPDTAVKGLHGILRCPVLGDFLQERCPAKLADYLNCGSDMTQELIANWSRIPDALARCNRRLSSAPEQPLSWVKSGHKLLICKPPQSAVLLRL